MSGGDFAGEASRLGQMTADMHLAMAEAFGLSPNGLADYWPALIASIEERLERLGPELMRLGQAVAQTSGRST